MLDSTGTPIASEVDLEVRLYDAVDAETPVWSEDYGAVTPEQGYVSLSLGSGGSLESSLFAESQGLWLELVADNQVIGPRSLLRHVPYAVVAQGLQQPTPQSLSASSAIAGAELISESVPLAGFAGPRVASLHGVDGGQVRVNGGPWVDSAVVEDGDAVQARVASVPVGAFQAQLLVGSAVFSWPITGDATAVSCRTLLESGITADGPQTIDIDGAGPRPSMDVWCDMAGGGWTYAAQGVPFTLYYTGTPQRLVTPIVATEYEFTLYGAAGGGKGYPAQDAIRHGAPGGMAKGRKSFEPSTPLYIYVGGEGAHSDIQDNDGCQNVMGGWNGGGRASRGGSGGGGATDLRLEIADLYSRILVAGGGGGCAYGGDSCDYAGGAGGGLSGGNGANPPSRTGSTGGTQLAGGTTSYDTYSNGSFGKGGDAAQCNDEGGGGGGWFGGAGGGRDNNTGGGGSSYYDGMDSAQETQAGANQRNGSARYIFR